MPTLTRVALVSLSVFAAACSSPSAPAAPPLVSGIDMTSADKAVRPQDDLFRHVNGGWLTRTEIPADRASWGSFDILLDRSQQDLRTIAEDAAKATERPAGSD
ncbi:MAG: hypothetical protein IT178_17185, partial [Acidobacteria bacterium]|nr:hypothetical protein [Acidobacteriota bacterium]